MFLNDAQSSRRTALAAPGRFLEKFDKETESPDRHAPRSWWGKPPWGSRRLAAASVCGKLVSNLVWKEERLKRVGAYEAKTHLPRLLKDVGRGERISITRRGVPVAELVPATGAGKVDSEQTVRKLKQFRKGISLGGLTIRELIEKGRRF